MVTDLHETGATDSYQNEKKIYNVTKEIDTK